MKKLSICFLFLLLLFSVREARAQITTRAIVAKVSHLPPLCTAYFVAINTPGEEEMRIMELKYYAREIVMDVRAIIDSTHTSIEKDNAYLVFRDQLQIEEVEKLIGVLKKLARQNPHINYKAIYQYETIHPVKKHLAVKSIQENSQMSFVLELYKTQITLRKNWIQELIQSLEEGLQLLKDWHE